MGLGGYLDDAPICVRCDAALAEEAERGGLRFAEQRWHRAPRKGAAASPTTQPRELFPLLCAAGMGLFAAAIANWMMSDAPPDVMIRASAGGYVVGYGSGLVVMKVASRRSAPDQQASAERSSQVPPYGKNR